MEGLETAARDTGQPLRVQGPGPMFHVGFTTQARIRDYRDTLAYDKARYAHFVREMQESGIRLIGRGLWYVSAAHTIEDIDYAVQRAREILAAMEAVQKAREVLGDMLE